MFDVAALGEGMVEFNQTAPGEPNYLQGFGGDTSNAAIAAARAGAAVAYLTRVGGDSFGRSLLDLWRREGVDDSAIEVAPDESTGIYFVTHGPSGHEFSYRRAGSAASRMSPAWLEERAAAVIRASRILHVSGISLAISPAARDTAFAAMEMARAAGCLVSFDSNLRLKLWTAEEARPALERAIALSDIFLPSLEDVTALTGLSDPDAVVDWARARGARYTVLKLGAGGAVADDGTRRERIAARPARLVDATGAGDCFCGNLLARIAAGDDLFAAARFANIAASLAVEGYGAVAPLPQADAVHAALAQALPPAA